jgi:putative ABC transport system permease protein
VANLRPLQALLDEEVAARSVQSSLLAGFAALALVLASARDLRVLSYTVACSAGARSASAWRSAPPAGEVVRHGGAPGAGAVGHRHRHRPRRRARAHARPLVAALRISATDPATFAAGAAALGLVAAVASWLPARQAARVDPK